MRSPKEVSFRLQQEIANAVLLFSQPRPQLGAQAPLEGLPSPQSVADAVRGTDYVRELIKLADQVLLGRIPIFDSEIDYGPAPAWRRDPLRQRKLPANISASSPISTWPRPAITSGFGRSIAISIWSCSRKPLCSPEISHTAMR